MSKIADQLRKAFFNDKYIRLNSYERREFVIPSTPPVAGTCYYIRGARILERSATGEIKFHFPDIPLIRQIAIKRLLEIAEINISKVEDSYYYKGVMLDYKTCYKGIAKSPIKSYATKAIKDGKLFKR